MSAAREDYSREALTERLGADVMAHIDALAAAAPEPHPDEYAMLRRLFNPPIPHTPAATQRVEQRAA